MAKEYTLTILKPDAIKKNCACEILSLISQNEFRIAALKMVQLSLNQAKSFYKEHEGKEFYEKLVDFMTSGPVMVVLLEKDNAVGDFRKLIGKTDPEKAEEGTVRKIYGTNQRENAVHGSDCNENAQREADFFFSQLERF